ncbi:MAG: hypothetical protein EOL87_00570 [Spartobacteria bacterium]|nr:hypothetical protein [Spartobacteria bacterium]
MLTSLNFFETRHPMRRRRIKRNPLAYYHCMTRIVGRQMLLGDVEKKHMHGLIRKVEAFTGVRVLTYALMTNHIHLLLEEPDRNTGVSDAILMERMRALYTADEMREIESRWADWLQQGNKNAVDCDKQSYSSRMHDISEFMKTLKHRFSFWYNRKHGRKGTLWAERFKSVLVEDGDALRTVAAYIEMNPVRAGLSKEPSSYPFCGFGEAVNGSREARIGITALMVKKDAAFGWDTSHDWPKLASRYFDDILMYGKIDIESGPSIKRLLSRCRYFTDGQVLGSKSFVEEFFSENREYFGEHRTEGGRKMKGDWDGLYAIRDVSSQRPNQ